MAPKTWVAEPSSLIRPFEATHRSPGAGALLLWAVQSVESLYYLGDLDEALWRDSFAGHNPEVADIAHVRWATGTCITGLDLCAAALGRAYCENVGDREFSLGYFDPFVAGVKQAGTRREKLPGTALDWVERVLADGAVAEVKAARDSLTHSRLPRHFELRSGERRRLRLDVDGDRVEVRHLIEQARNVATKWVEGFLELLPSLTASAH